MVDLDTLRPGDRLEHVDGSIVRVQERSPDGEHLSVVYESSESDIFADGDESLIYAHEIARVYARGEDGGEA